MISYVFQHTIEGIYGIWAPSHFLSKSGCQKYTTWVPGDPTPSCFCNVISLFEETNKVSEPNCYTYVFSLLNSTLVWFMWSLINWAFPLVGPWGPISYSKVAKIFYAYQG